jgi:hypothetical protein
LSVTILLSTASVAWAEDATQGLASTPSSVVPALGPSAMPASGPQSVDQPVTPATRWYGGQTLLVDAAAIAAVVGGAALRWHSTPHGDELPPSGCDSRCTNFGTSMGDVLLFVGFAGYALGSPIVHITHDKPGKAAASFGMRLLPVLLGGAGLAICDGGVCVYEVPGALLGVLVAGIDGALATEEVSATKMVRLTPFIDITARRTTVGVGGTF